MSDVLILNPKSLERILALPDPAPEADGTCRWQGPYGRWSSKPFQRGSTIYLPFRPGVYTIRGDDHAIVWNVPEILAFFGIPETKENTEAVTRTLEGVALATGKQFQIARADA